MRTVFVNPRKTSRKRKSKKHGLSRRRNAGVASFIQPNPLILENPRHRRRSRRRNTSLVANPRRRRHKRSHRRNPSFDVKSITKSLVAYGGGAALAFAVDNFIIKKIPVPASMAQYSTYVNTGLRLAGAVLSAKYIKGDMGAAAAGALMYPAIQELAIKFNLPVGGGASVEHAADLMADLESFEDLIDEESVLDGF